MSPVLSERYKRNSRFVNVVFVAKFFVRDVTLSIPAANFGNLIFGQFRIAVSFFAGHIQNIVGLSANEQVGRIDARRIVTRMANAHAFGDRPIMQFVTVSVRKLFAAVNGHLAVPVVVTVSGPFPTFLRRNLVYLTPESFDGATLGIVPMYKANGLTSNPSIFSATLGRNRGQLPASALAITVWNFVRGIIEGHSDLQSLCQRSGRFQRRRPTFLQSFIIPQIGGAS